MGYESCPLTSSNESWQKERRWCLLADVMWKSWTDSSAEIDCDLAADEQ